MARHSNNISGIKGILPYYNGKWKVYVVTPNKERTYIGIALTLAEAKDMQQAALVAWYSDKSLSKFIENFR